MRFKQPHTPPPTVNLIPMLDVMMTVLTFFIVLAMVLGRQSTIDLALPGPDEPKSTDTEKLPDPLIIDLANNDKFSISKKPLSLEQVTSAVKAYLAKNPKGAVLLKPNPDLPYEKVLQALGDLRQVDPQRVSLGIEGPEAAEAGDEAAPADDNAPAVPPLVQEGESAAGEAPAAEGAEPAPATEGVEPAPAAEDAPAEPAPAEPAPAPAAEAWPED